MNGNKYFTITAGARHPTKKALPFPLVPTPLNNQLLDFLKTYRYSYIASSLYASFLKFL